MPLFVIPLLICAALISVGSTGGGLVSIVLLLLAEDRKDRGA